MAENGGRSLKNKGENIAGLGSKLNCKTEKSLAVT